MTAKEEALRAIDRAIGLMPKDGTMTPLDSSLVRVALGHAREMVDYIEELRQPRRVKKEKGPLAGGRAPVEILVRPAQAAVTTI